jgi:hypothetical protein
MAKKIIMAAMAAIKRKWRRRQSASAENGSINIEKRKHHQSSAKAMAAAKNIKRRQCGASCWFSGESLKGEISVA